MVVGQWTGMGVCGGGCRNLERDPLCAGVQCKSVRVGAPVHMNARANLSKCPGGARNLPTRYFSNKAAAFLCNVTCSALSATERRFESSIVDPPTRVFGELPRQRGCSGRTASYRPSIHSPGSKFNQFIAHRANSCARCVVLSCFGGRPWLASLLVSLLMHCCSCLAC